MSTNHGENNSDNPVKTVKELRKEALMGARKDDVTSMGMKGNLTLICLVVFPLLILLMVGVFFSPRENPHRYSEQIREEYPCEAINKWVSVANDFTNLLPVGEAHETPPALQATEGLSQELQHLRKDVDDKIITFATDCNPKDSSKKQTYERGTYSVPVYYVMHDLGDSPEPRPDDEKRVLTVDLVLQEDTGQWEISKATQSTDIVGSVEKK